MANNITLTKTWTPIGTASVPFTGSFDGNGYKISDLSITRTTDNNGFFGYTNNALIRNLGLENVSVTAGVNYIGGLIGNATLTTIEKCYVSGSISSKVAAHAGGLVGYLNGGSISESYSTATTSVTHYAGGLVGYAIGKISAQCYSGGLVAGGAPSTALIKNSAAINTGVLGSLGNYTVGRIIVVNGSVSNCLAYDDMPVIRAGVAINVKITNPTADSVNGKNTTLDDLYKKATYTGLGWDFTDVWQIDEGIGAPTLRMSPGGSGLNVAVADVAFSETAKTMNSGATYQITATVSPSTATTKTLTWTSSNPSVATVDTSGLVTAISIGQTVITATSNNNITAKCTITVSATSIPVSGISLSETAKTIIIGNDPLELTATVTPAGATDKSISWESGDETVATVDANGKVTAVSVGTATITAISNSNNSMRASCTVTVQASGNAGENPVLVSEIILTPTSQTLNVADTLKLNATILPNDATDKTITYSSSNKKVATVNANGKITAVAPGEATITATSSNNIKGICTITVAVPSINVTSIEIVPDAKSMNIGTTYILSANMMPLDATNTTATWKSNTPGVATVDQNGKVTALAEGQTIITATSHNGLVAKCTVTVAAQIFVSDIILTNSTVKLGVDETLKLIPEVKPYNATDQTLTYKSSNNNIAKINASGKITAVAQGQTDIVITAIGGTRAVCTVIVSAKENSAVAVDSVQILPATVSLSVNETQQLTAKISPNNAADKSIQWLSNNESIVSVDSNGVITANRAGQTTVTAKSVNGILAECQVIVAPTVISVGGVELDYATDQTVTWNSKTNTVATVSKGVVTAKATGSTVIVAKTADGSYKAECVVTVVEE